MTLTDCMYQEKKYEEDLPVFKLASIYRLENCIRKRGGRLITATRHNTDKPNDNRTKINRKKWEENQLYRHFKRQTIEITQKGRDMAKKEEP